MRLEPAGYGAVTDAGTGEAAGTSQALFYVGHSSKTLLSSKLPSQSAKLIERNRTKHKEGIAWAPARLQMGWPGKQWMKPRKNPPPWAKGPGNPVGEPGCS